MRGKRVRNVVAIFFIVGGILSVVHGAEAQDSINSTASDMTTITTTTPLLPPQTLKLSREGSTTLVFIDAGANKNDTIYAYRIYRRCNDTTWWSLAKVSTRECGGFVCSYKVEDKSGGDICEYSVSSVDLAGNESERTASQRVSVSAMNNATSLSQATTGAVATTSAVSNDAQYTVAGRYMIYLRTQNVQSVEWSMSHEGSQTSIYLGKATYNKDKDYWEYVWDTTKVPNGSYVLSPKIYSAAGQKYENTPMYVQVKNDSASASAQGDQTLAGTIQQMVKEAVTVVDQNTQREQLVKESIVQTIDPYVKNVQDSADTKGETVAKQELVAEQERAKKEMITLLNIESSKLLSALNGDEEEYKRFENKVIIASEKSTKNIDAIAKEFGITLSQDELDALTKEVTQKVVELEGVIKERREVLKGRVGDKVFEDSDKDGISNYDEVNIYKTNPLMADTDGDGFFDGAEILGGYDPLSPAKQAVVEYEQPRTDGFVEDDTFAVNTVRVTETAKVAGGAEDASKILFKGVAPANSFATLYVYSMPIIMTVKTDADGNWSYELDKELENGNHEVYVAITDNAGKIFAKSKPLPFIKTATAVTIDDAALQSTTENPAKSLFDQTYLYGIGILIVGLIGGALVVSGHRSRSYNE